MYAVVTGRPAHQRTPAAADVEQPLAGTQPELATDVLQLVPLSLIQRFVGTREIGAGVHALLIEPQTIELVGDVVMERDRTAVLRP
jgi:hypothetical protein